MHKALIRTYGDDETQSCARAIDCSDHGRRETKCHDRPTLGVLIGDVLPQSFWSSGQHAQIGTCTKTSTIAGHNYRSNVGIIVGTL
jgi:hypothetical protein